MTLIFKKQKLKQTISRTEEPPSGTEWDHRQVPILHIPGENVILRKPSVDSAYNTL